MAEQAKRSAELVVIIYCNLALTFTLCPVYVVDFERLALATPLVDQGEWHQVCSTCSL